MRLTWLGHSSVKIETGSQVIYIDPYAGLDEWYTAATLILVSRFHFDHCSIEKIKRLSHDGTRVLGTKEVAAQVFPCGVLLPNQSVIFGDVEVVGMPVKNPHADLARHQEARDSVGFVILAENKKVYFTADSDYFAELTSLDPDVLLISVGGTYTADSREAAQIANIIRPKLAIPIHWGTIAGTRDDADYFKELAHMPVTILQAGESVTI